MAAVGQRLGYGVYRLSVLRNSHGRPLCTGESPESLQVSRTFSGNWTNEESTPDRLEVQPLTKSRSKQRKSAKLSIVRTSESQPENGPLCYATFMEMESSSFIRVAQTRECLQAYKLSLYLSVSLQPLVHHKFLPGRMTTWNKRAVSVHPETFRSPQQLRSFCTVIFFLTEPGSERPCYGLTVRRLKIHHGSLQAYANSRSYSWRSDSSSKDTPPLHRSKTAYYDILKVSPGATQSQIKTAYYKQSFIHHPDKNPGNDQATQHFSEISEAYTVLGNISLRRKYDRGILNQSDIRSAERPSSKETTSRSTGSSQQQQHQHRVRRFSQTGGKTMFDFDAFYQAHYGEQLRRERDMRARKQHIEEQQKKNLSRWKQEKMMEMTVLVVLAMAGLILVNLSSP